MGIFLEINSYSLDAPETETVVIIEQLAAGNFSETELVKWLSDTSVFNA